MKRIINEEIGANIMKLRNQVKRGGGKLLVSLMLIFAIVTVCGIEANAADAPSATIYDISLEGKVGEQIVESIAIDVHVDKIKSPNTVLKPGQITTNLPQEIKVTGETSPSGMSIVFIGTFTSASSGQLEITLSGDLFESGNPITVTPNPNAKWNIKGDGYAITINDGTSAKSEYEKDETVTIIANTPATGKQFKEWTVISGGVTLADPKSSTTTFTMPPEAVEVKAVYEEISTPSVPEQGNVTPGTTPTQKDAIKNTASARTNSASNVMVCVSLFALLGFAVTYGKKKSNLTK